MQSVNSTYPRLGIVVACLLATAGCESVLGSGDSAPVSLSFSTPRSGVSASLRPALAPITGGGHTVDVQQVEVFFSEVVLERAEGGMGGDSDGDSESDSDSDGPGNERFRSGPVTVNLPLGGGVITPFTTTLPAGFYEELEMDVAKVRVVGTYDGQGFDVTLPVDAELEMEFNPAFEVTTEANKLNLTVSIDALTWFRNTDGTVVDPRQLASSSDLRSRIARRIKESFKAFEDSDKDADDADSDSDSDSDSK